MSLLEPRCMVCGAPLDKGAPFKKTPRESEVCSDKCYSVYMGSSQDIVCPFCGEEDFDLTGLKIHLTSGHCEAYENAPTHDEGE